MVWTVKPLFVIFYFITALQSLRIARAETIAFTTPLGANISSSATTDNTGEKVLITLTQPSGCYISLMPINKQVSSLSTLSGIDISLANKDGMKASWHAPIGKKSTITYGGISQDFLLSTGSVKLPIVINHRMRGKKVELNISYLTYCPASSSTSEGELITNDFAVLFVTGDRQNNLSITQKNTVLQNVNIEIKVLGERKFAKIIKIVFFSFFGGLLINIMPCALPMLGIKLKFLSQSKSGKNFVKTILLSAFVGIIFAFLLIGLGTCGVISMMPNGNLTWGSGFQSPMFIAFLISAVFVLLQIHANSTSCRSLISHNAFLSRSAAVIYGFFSGMVNTFLSTSCLAPVISTALILSSQNQIETLISFVFIGIGFGLPHLLVIIYHNFPKVVEKSKISNLIHDGIGPMMMVTILWLSYLLSCQVDMIYPLLILLLVIVGGYAVSKIVSILFKIVVLGAVVASIIGIVWVPLHSSETNNTIEWTALSDEIIDEAILDDKVSFVSISADWCITCKINNYIAFKNNDFIELVKKNEIKMIDGDVTSENEVASEFMKDFGAKGVPLNVIFSQKNPSGRVLASFLTGKYLIEEIERELEESEAIEIEEILDDDSINGFKSGGDSATILHAKQRKISTKHNAVPPPKNPRAVKN